MTEIYDFAIIGGGPTGYVAAMYAGRLGLKTIIFSPSPGGLIINTAKVENYPGFKSINGFDIFKKIQEHAKEYKIIENSSKVRKVSMEKKNLPLFNIKAGKNTVKTKSILFATGSEYRKLPLPEAQKFENKGIHYCALCDGFAYKNKTVAVVGGADSALKGALELTQHSQKVYIIARGDKLRGEPINQKRVSQNSKIEVILNTNIREIIGEEEIIKVRLDKPYKSSVELILDGIFVAIGHLSRSELAESLGVKINERKQIIINRYTETNVPGVFAAGDVTDTEFKQLITGCAEGVIAAYNAFKYVTWNHES